MGMRKRGLPVAAPFSTLIEESIKNIVDSIITFLTRAKCFCHPQPFLHRLEPEPGKTMLR
jgi:hypothetical protein